MQPVYGPLRRRSWAYVDNSTPSRGVFAQKLTRAYRTVSLNSALVLAGVLPLDLRVREAAALYEARKGKPQQVLLGREMERVAAYSETPHPAEHMCLEFISLVDQIQIDLHNTQEVRIFTDGSRIEGGVGAALSIWDGVAETKSLKLGLSPYCTVYQAELLAICEASRWILKSAFNSFGIYSDSRSALETVVSNSSRHPLAMETRKNFHKTVDQGRSISLFWIKAHAGFDGNERADALAKTAARRTNKAADYDRCPVSFIKRHIRLRSLDEWNQRYQSCTTGMVTKMFIPDAVRAYKMVRELGPSGILTQVMTGHGGFSEYLHRFRCKESPSCICDQGVDETVAHVLFDCPVFCCERFDLEQRLATKLNGKNIHKFFSDKIANKHIVEYCIKLANRVVKRNK